MNAWLLIILAGLLETAWAIGLKYSEGFSRPLPSVLTILGALGSFWLLARAMQDLPVGTAYAVWVGIGATLTLVWGFVTGQERPTIARILLLVLLVGSVIGLKAVS